MNYDVAVIGGGISGLTTARELAAAGQNVIVLERQQKIGGNAISENINGFLMEHGPTTLNATVPEALNLASELGLDGEKIDMGDGVKKRYLRSKDKLHAIDINPTGFFRSNYLSLSARASMLAEIIRPVNASDEDETVHQFATRRFGREFADKVMEPMAAGIFAGDSKKLSVRSVFPKLVAMEQKQGSITRAVIKAKKGAEPANRLFSFAKGVGTLPAAINETLGNHICRGVAVTNISKTISGFRIETPSLGKLSARSVIIATQPHVAANLMEDIDPIAASAAASITAPPLSVVFLGYRREQVKHPLDSLGFLGVKGENGILTGAQFCSTLFSGRAPDGYVSIAGYVGGVRNPEAAQMPKDQLIQQVHKEFSDLLKISGEPVLMRTRQWTLGLPQYEIGHSKLKKTLLSTNERTEGLFLTGNYLSGVSIANCIEQAKITASAVSSYLAEQDIEPVYKFGSGLN